jgi:hypothetical protein
MQAPYLSTSAKGPHEHWELLCIQGSLIRFRSIAIALASSPQGQGFEEGTLNEREGSVHLTSLYQLV